MLASGNASCSPSSATTTPSRARIASASSASMRASPIRSMHQRDRQRHDQQDDDDDERHTRAPRASGWSGYGIESEHVAGAAPGLDEAFTAAQRELASQPLHVDVDDVRQRVVGLVPDMLGDLGSGRRPRRRGGRRTPARRIHVSSAGGSRRRRWPSGRACPTSTDRPESAPEAARARRGAAARADAPAVRRSRTASSCSRRRRCRVRRCAICIASRAVSIRIGAVRLFVRRSRQSLRPSMSGRPRSRMTAS